MFILVSAFSLLLFIVYALASAFSPIRPVNVAFPRGGYFWEFTLNRGYASVSRIDDWQQDEPVSLDR